MVPARLVFMTDAQMIGLLQIAGMVVFLLIYGLWLRSNAISLLLGKGTRASAAAGFGLILIIPFALWGALGSPLDLLINILTALLFGLCAGLLIAGSLYGGASENAGRNTTS